VSRRSERIGNLIRAILAREIQTRLSDPRIERFTSITRIEVSSDLSVARVYASVMAPPARQRLCIQALQHAAGKLRAALARQVRMRQIPRLEFILDDSVKQAFQTVQMIDAAMAELGVPAPWENPGKGAAAKNHGPTSTDREQHPATDEQQETG